MSLATTSAVFAVWRAFERMLADLTFPTMVENPTQLVSTWFGNPDLVPVSEDLSNERVVIMSGVTEPNEEWGPLGNGARSERFAAHIAIVTAVPGRSTAQARDRVEEIAVPVEHLVQSVSRARGNPALSPPEWAPFPVWAVEQRSFQPLITVTPDGVVGRGEFVIYCQFRVGTPPVS